MKNEKLNALVPLESLNEKPIYSGTTSLAEYDENINKQNQDLDDLLKSSEPIVNSGEGRKKTIKKKEEVKIDSTPEEEKPKEDEKSTKKKLSFNFSLKSIFGSIGKTIDKKIRQRNQDDDAAQRLIREDSEEKEKKEDKTQHKPKIPIFGKPGKPLEEIGYPMKVKIPVDIEIVDGQKGLYFNIEKYLEYKEKLWITKIIPIHLLDKMTYNKAMFDKYALGLHDEAIEYNKMSAEEQYKFDKKRKKRTFFLRIGFLAIAAVVTMLSVVPNYQSKNARSLMRSAQYQQAFEAYEGISKPSDLDKFYKEYCRAMGYLQAGNYEKAKEGIFKLEGYSANGVDLNSALNEILYQEAEALYKEGKYAAAANNLKVTYNYKDSKARFLEASYKSLDELMNAEHFEEAMKMLSLLGDYKDSEAIGNEFMEKLYQDAHQKYNKGLYSEAEKLFYYVAQNDYKDSKTMIYQAQYNAGLEYYKKKDYTKAIEQLSKIAWFKDASAMLSDMYYTKGKALIDENPIKAYDNLVNCIMFRDTIDILERPELVLYGEWSLDKYNGSVVSDVGLNFDFDGRFTTNNPKSIFIKDLKISDNKKSYKYKFKNDVYKVKGSKKTLSVYTEDINNLLITVSDEDEKNELTLRRLKPIERTNLDMFTSIRDSLYEYIDDILERGGKK